MVKFNKLFVTLSALTLSSTAFGSSYPEYYPSTTGSCDSPLSSYNWYVSQGDSAGAAQVVANHPGCFPGGSTSSSAQISATTFQQINAISTAISARQIGMGGPVNLAAAGNIKGLAAGGKGNPLNVWGNISSNETRQSYLSGASLVNNGLNVTNAVIGADYALASGMVAGVSLAMDHTNGNQNTNTTTISMASNGYSLAPYLGWQLSKNLSLDASIGFGSSKTSMSGAKTDANRWFTAANLSYSEWQKNIQLTGKLSLLHGEEKSSDTTNSAGTVVTGTAATSKVDQLRLGGQVGYWADGVMPYVGLGYTTDLSRSSALAGTTDPIGRSAWVGTVGAHFISMAKGVTGGIAYNTETGRSNQTNKSLMANLSIRF